MGSEKIHEPKLKLGSAEVQPRYMLERYTRGYWLWQQVFFVKKPKVCFLLRTWLNHTTETQCGLLFSFSQVLKFLIYLFTEFSKESFGNLVEIDKTTNIFHFHLFSLQENKDYMDLT